jgi:cobalamin biosynthesis protein CbiD
VFYVLRDSEPTLIPCADKLGDMINELKPCEHVSEIVSAGLKNYAYKIANSTIGEDKSVCKVRCITLNYSA